MSENVYDYEQALKQVEEASKSYDLNADVENTVGKVDVKQVMETAPIRQLTGERASTPNYDEGIREGVAVSDRVHRGIQRANYALAQTAEGEREKWADRPSFFSRPYPKCNEFVCDTHISGDPQGFNYPKVKRDNPSYDKPVVKELADPNFAKGTLEYHKDATTPWPGDTVVWYDGNGTHYSGIALGNGKVAYASTDGAKVNSIEKATANLNGTAPIIRRFR